MKKLNKYPIFLVRQILSSCRKLGCGSLVILCLILVTSCEEAKVDTPSNGVGPEISGLTVSPNSDVQYGDALLLAASLQHDAGLYAYSIQILSDSDVLFEKIQLLTGKNFDVEERITLPLPKNATNGDLKIVFQAKDYDHNSTVQELAITNVQLPDIDQLYLILDNNKVFPMIPDNGIFVVKDFIPANATGKIYVNPDKSGLHWGMSNGVIAPLGKNSIPIGKESEAFFEISFDPYSFEMEIGGAEIWTAIDESLYILGGISGHWADGVISSERSKMKMKGYQSGNEKYWTWTPPNDGTGSPETDMWGSIVAGTFRFKLAGQDQFITFANGAVTLGPDDPGAAFLVSVGGSFTIKVYQVEGVFTRVSLEDSERTLEYTSEGIFINGVAVPQAISFAGSDIPLKENSYFTFEGPVSLTNGQTVSASGIDLRSAFADPDVFSGGGNTNWKCVGTDGEYLLRLDPFSGSVYVCKLGGYPDVIYLDGWAFGRHASDNRPAWDPTSRMCLYRNGDGFQYTGSMYVYPWGGDVSLWAAPYTEEDHGSQLIASRHFNGVTEAGDGFLLPVPSEPGGLYEISVDLKDGFTFDKTLPDGGHYTLVPTNGKKFSVSFTPK